MLVYCVRCVTVCVGARQVLSVGVKLLRVAVSQRTCLSSAVCEETTGAAAAVRRSQVRVDLIASRCNCKRYRCCIGAMSVEIKLHRGE